MRIILITTLMMALLIAMGTAAACQVYDTEENKILEDYDCDVFPDVDDNCPRISNPSQADKDGDGIGDACEKERGADARDSGAADTDLPDTGHVELQDYDLSSERIIVEHVSLKQIPQDGPGEFYTIRIRNNKEYPLITNLKIQMGDWATYIIEPQSSQVVDEEAKYYLYVSPKPGIGLGEKEFTALLNLDGEQKTLRMYADIIPAGNYRNKIDNTAGESLDWAETILIILIILMLAIGLSIGYQRMKGAGK